VKYNETIEPRFKDVYSCDVCGRRFAIVTPLAVCCGRAARFLPANYVPPKLVTLPQPTIPQDGRTQLEA